MASLWLPNVLLSDELVDAALQLYEADLESHDRVLFRQGLALARDEAERAGERKDPGVAGKLRSDTLTRPRGYCEFCGDKVKPGERLEVEHMVSRLSGQALRVPWSILHASPNLAAVCRPCNKRKGTCSLAPADMRWMWGYHHFGGPSEEAHVLLFFADLLGQHAWEAIPLRVKIEADLGRTVAPKPTIGAFLREQDGATRHQIMERWSQARGAVEAMKGRLWENEGPSDDNREMWGRAGWQR